MKIQKIIAVILSVGVILSNTHIESLYAEVKNSYEVSLSELNKEESTSDNSIKARANNSDSNVTVISDRVYSYSRSTWTDWVSKDTYWKYRLNIGGKIRTVTINKSSKNYAKALDRLEYIKRQIDNNIFLKNNSKNGIKTAIKNELAYLGLGEESTNQLADTIINALENSSSSAVKTITDIIVENTPSKVEDVLEKATNRANAIISICFGIVAPINATNIKNAFSEIEKLDLEGPTNKPTIKISNQLYNASGMTVTVTGTASGSNQVEIFYGGKKTTTKVTSNKYTLSIKVDNLIDTIYIAGIDSYGNRGAFNQITLEKNSPPVITASNKTTTVGTSINLLYGVEAKDKEDGDLTRNVIVASNNVKFNKVGTYSVTYAVLDKGGIRSEKTVNVTVKPKKSISVKSVSLNKTRLSLINGNTAQLIATVNPSNATNKNVTWSSSNTKVATVDENGKVKAVGAGSAKITVKTKDGSKIATCNVTVNHYKTQKVTFKINVPSKFTKKHYVEIIDTSTGEVVYTSGLKSGSRTLTFSYTLTTANTSHKRKIRIKLKDGKIFDTNTFSINKNTINKSVIATYQSSINGNVKNGTVTQK